MFAPCSQPDARTLRDSGVLRALASEFFGADDEGGEPDAEPVRERDQQLIVGVELPGFECPNTRYLDAGGNCKLVRAQAPLGADLADRLPEEE
jgi:hypothetical protein